MANFEKKLEPAFVLAPADEAAILAAAGPLGTNSPTIIELKPITGAEL